MGPTFMCQGIFNVAPTKVSGPLMKTLYVSCQMYNSAKTRIYHTHYRQHNNKSLLKISILCSFCSNSRRAEAGQPANSVVKQYIHLQHKQTSITHIFH